MFGLALYAKEGPMRYDKAYTNRRHNAQRRYSSQRRRTAGMRRIYMAAAAALIVILILTLKLTAQETSADEQPVPMTYTSVQVHAGDTIWSIAEDWQTDEWPDTRAYVEEIKSVNGLSGDTIHAGNYLVIPYYDHDLSHID